MDGSDPADPSRIIVLSYSGATRIVVDVPETLCSGEDDHVRDVCEYLGGRADKDFLGTGTVGLVIQAVGARLLFAQRWQAGGVFDWAAGTVRAWAPDRIELNEPMPPVGAQITLLPSARWVFAARDDVLGLTLEWKNDTASIEPWACKQLTLFLGLGVNQPVLEESLSRWQKATDILDAVRQDRNGWFDRAIPRFRTSNPYFEKLYYYRWWSLYTKMVFARVGHLLYPAPREGAVAFEACVSYSGACISVDELRWMRDPAWAFSTTREFFSAENLNDGYLSNHIWDWGIDGDESNQDGLGRSVPYHNYAVAAFHGALLVYPDEGLKTLQDLWPHLCSNLESYPRLFDIVPPASLTDTPVCISPVVMFIDPPWRSGMIPIRPNPCLETLTIITPPGSTSSCNI